MKVEQKVMRDEADAIRQRVSQSYSQEGSQLDVAGDIENLKILEDQLEQTIEAHKHLEGVLIYRGNRLIRRLECPFGEILDEEELGLRSRLKEQHHAIISIFKSKSTTNVDKSDFAEKQVVKKVREWFRLQYKNNSL